MDALLFAMVLEVSLLQIRIQEGSTELRSRYWKCTSKIEKAQCSKLDVDRRLLRDVLCQTLVEVIGRGRWGPLAAAARALEQRARAAVALRLSHDRLRQLVSHTQPWSTFSRLVRKERARPVGALEAAVALQLFHDRLRLSRKALTEDLNLKRHRWDEDLFRTDREIAYLRDKLKDDLLNASTRLRYAERWLGARAEALELLCQWRGPPLPHQHHERRVHDELARAFQLQIEERERALEYWRIRYSDDTADINTRLADVRERYVEATRRREKLQSLYDLHEGEMRGWLTFKHERAARLAREDRQRAAATLLQAWWRGVMVRRALGQYKYLRNVKKPAAKTKKK